MFKVRACAIMCDDRRIVLEKESSRFLLPCVELGDSLTPEELLERHLAKAVKSRVCVNEAHGTLIDREQRNLYLLYSVECLTTLNQDILSKNLVLVEFSALREAPVEPAGVLSLIHKNTSGELLRLKSIVERSINNCPWVERHLFSQAVSDLVSEIDELEEALSMRQEDIVAAELGDVLYDAMLAVWIFCRDNNCNPSSVLRAVGNKISWRKPWLFENTQISLEEAEGIWQDRKSME
ncbi:MAG: MazG nucleotide pyrophosphohydrolase [Thermotogales bacterium 46_20]|nr:MAG: MazG nucleotide pyrophosphohydrolase [Thermotogales bacterium 46_20]